MQMIGGTYGRGFGQYNNFQKILHVSPDSIFHKSKYFSLSDLMSLQQIDANSSKKIGETISLGGAGLLIGGLFGPLGGLVGLATGMMAGGKKTKVIFGVNTKTGEVFLFSAEADEFYGLQNDLGSATLREQKNIAAEGIPDTPSASPAIVPQSVSCLIAEKMNKIRSAEIKNPQSNHNAIEVKLIKLKHSRDAGLINEQEYSAHKKRIIENL